MKKIYLLVAAIIYSVNVNAQAPDWVWAKGIGGAGSESGNSITTDPYGNIYTTGIFVGTVDFDPGPGVFNLVSVDSLVIDAFVCKTDTAGNFIWAKALGGIDTEVGRSIAFDPSGSGAVYISGNFRGTSDFDPGAGVFNVTSFSSGYTDAFICKLDTAGNFIWAKAMGGGTDDASSSIAIDPSGTGAIYSVGYFRGTADFDPDAGTFYMAAVAQTDIFVSKYNSSGNFIWAKQMGGSNYDWGMFIAKGPAGSTDVYTTGFFAGTADFDPGAGTYNIASKGFDDVFISKLDSAGNFVWAKGLGGTDNDNGTSIATDISGNVYTTGYFKGTADFDPDLGIYNLTSFGLNDIFISKLDNAGNFVWAKGIGGTGYDIGNDITSDANGNLYTIGGFNGTVDFDPGAGVTNLTSAGNIDIFISRLDTSGSFVWAEQAGGTNGDNCRSLVVVFPGHFYVTGSFSSTTLAFGSVTLINTGTGQSDIFIAKLDAVIPTGIETISVNEVSISVFPNPFTDELTVRSSEAGEIKIYDVFGRIIYSEKLLTLNCKLQTSNWSNGIYFLEVNSGGQRIVKKIVKE